MKTKLKISAQIIVLIVASLLSIPAYAAYTVSGSVSLNAATITDEVLFDNDSSSSLTLNNGSTVQGDLKMSVSGQSISLSNSLIRGKIDGPGDLNIYENLIYYPVDNIGSIVSLDNINVAHNGYLMLEGKTVISDNITMAGGGIIYLDDASTLHATNINLNGAFSRLQFGAGDIVGNIDGANSATKTGIVTISQNTAGLPSNTIGSSTVIGSSNGIAYLNIGSSAVVNNMFTVNLNSNVKASFTTILSGASLNLGDAKSITGDVLLNSGSKLILGSGSSVSGKIDGGVAGVGSLEVNGGQDTDTVSGDIGATSALANIDIKSGVLAITDGTSSVSATNINIDIGEFDFDGGSINASNVNLSNAAKLKISGDSSLNVDAINGDGLVEFAGNSDISTDAEIGANSAVQSVTVNGGSVSFLSSIRANEVVVTGGDASLNLAAGKSITIADSSSLVQLSDGGGLTLNDGSVVYGSIEGGGFLNIASDSTVVTQENIGNSSSLAGINILGGATLDAATNNNSLSATNISLGENAILKAGSSIVGEVYGDSAGHGTLNVNSSTVVTGSVGSFGALSTVNVGDANGSAFLTVNGNLKANEINLNHTSSTLTLNVNSLNGALVGVVDGSSANQGYVFLSKNGGGTLNIGSDGIIGSTNGISHLYIGDGTGASFNSSIKSEGVDIGTGASAASLSMLANQHVQGSVSIGSGSSLVLNNNSYVTGSINGMSSGEGALNVAEFATVATRANVGFGSNSLSAINVLNNATLDVATNNNSLAATTISLGNGAELKIGNSTISGNIDGMVGGAGLVRVVGDAVLNGDIGSSHTISSLVLASGSTLDLATNNNSVSANSLSLSSGAVLNMGSGSLAVTNGATLSNNATINLASGDFSGTIDGSSANQGVVNLTADRTLSPSSRLGFANGLAAINITGNANIVANSSIKSLVVNVGDGSGGASFALDSARIMEGSLVIADDATVTLGNNSVVSGVINGADTALGTIDSIGAGYLYIAQNATVQAQNSIGGSQNALNAVVLSSGSSLDMGSNSIRANLISLSSDSNLTIGTGEIHASVIFGDSDGSRVGTLTINGNNAINSAIHVDALNVASSSNISFAANAFIDATTTTIGNGAGDVTFTLAANNSISGNVVIDEGSSLNLNNFSFVEGVINGASSGVGSLNIIGGESGAFGHIGSSNALGLVSLGAGTNEAVTKFHMQNYSISATEVTLDANSELWLGSGVVTGTIKGASDGVGDVIFDSSQAIAGDVGVNDFKLHEVKIFGGVAISAASHNIKATNININSGSSLSSAAAIVGDVSIGESSSLTLNNGAIFSGNITGPLGALNIGSNANIIAGGDIGAQNSLLASVSIANGATLDTSTNSTDFFVANTTLGSGSNLVIGGGGFASSIKGSSNATGKLTVEAGNDNNLLKTNGNIGAAGFSLEQIEIFSGINLDAATNNNSLFASTISLNNGSILIVQDADLIGTIEGVNNGDGTLILQGDRTISSDTIIGSQDHALRSVMIGADVIAQSAIMAETTTVAEGSLSLNANLTGNVIIGEGSSLNINSSIIYGDIDGYSAGAGNVNLAQNAGFSGNLGSNNAVANFNIASGVEAFIISNNINATNINLANGASLTMGVGNLSASNINLGSNAALDIASGEFVGNVDGSSAGYGDVYFSSDRTIDSSLVLGSSNGLNSVNIYADVDAVSSIKATSVNIGDANLEVAGNLRLAFGEITGNVDIFGSMALTESSVSGNIKIGSNSTLFLMYDVSIGGSILGSAASTGSLDFFGANLTANNNIGSLENSLANISIGTGSQLDMGGNSVFADSISLGFLSNLTLTTGSLNSSIVTLGDFSSINIGAGSVNSSIDGYNGGYGSVNFQANNVINHSIGANVGIDSVNIEGNSAVTLNSYIGANLINIGDGQNAASLIVLEDKDIDGDVQIAASSSLTLNRGSSVSGQIYGSNAPDSYNVGDLIISENSSMFNSDNIGGNLNEIKLTGNGNDSIYSLSTFSTSPASVISVGEGSVLQFGSSSIASEVKGLSNGVGSVEFNNNYTLGGSVGATNHKLDSVTIGSYNDIDTNGHAIKSNSVNISEGSVLRVSAVANEDYGLIGDVNLYQDSSLRLDGVSAVSGNIDADSSGVGSIIIEDESSVSLHGNIGATNKLSSIEVGGNSGLSVVSTNFAVNEITLKNNSSLDITAESISANIDGESQNRGTLILRGNSNITSDSSIGAINNLAEVRFYGSSSTNEGSINAENIKIGNGNTASSLTMLSNSSLVGDIKIGSGSNLIINNGGSFSGSVNGASEGVGSLTLVDNQTDLSGNIGNIFALQNIILQGSSVLNLANSTFRANNILLGNDSVLNVGSDSIEGVIRAVDSVGGIVNFNQNNTLSTNIGTSDHLINNVIVNSNLAIDTNGHEINSSYLQIGESSTLSSSANVNSDVAIGLSAALILNQGASVSGRINGLENGVGVLNIGGMFWGGAELAFVANHDIGSANALETVYVGDYSSIDLAANNKSIAATNINLGNESTITVGSGEVRGSIYGGNSGNVIFTQNNALYGNLGSTDGALNSVTLASNASLHLAEHQIVSQSVTLGSGSSITLNNGSSINADVINGNSSGAGSINIASDSNGEVTIYGYIGATNKINEINLQEDSSLYLNGSVSANKIIMGSNSDLHSYGSSIDAEIDGQAANSGTLSIVGEIGDFLISENSQIGSTNGIASLKIAAAVSSGASIKAATVNIGNSTGNNFAIPPVAGSLNLAANKSITGNVIIDEDSSLILNDGSSVSGFISGVSNGSNGVGSLNIAANSSVVSEDVIGFSSAKLGSITIEENAVLNASTNNSNIAATNVYIGNGANLYLGSGGLSAVVDGQSVASGTLNLESSNSFAAGVKLGNVNGLSAINIASSVSINIADSIRSTKITLGSDSSLNIAANKVITGDVELGENATLILNNQSAVSGEIKGAAELIVVASVDEDIRPASLDGQGVVTTAGNISVERAIGQSRAISVLNISSGTLTSSHDIAANNINIAGVLSLENSAAIAGNITVNSGGKINIGNENHVVSGNFTANSGSSIALEVNNEVSAASLTVAGVAIISPNTTLYVNLGSSATNAGASYTIVSGQEGSSINQISASRIKLNGGNTNRVGSLAFSTVVSGNSLVLNVAEAGTAPEQTLPVISNPNQSQAYEAIASVENASGALAELQDYLNSDIVSNEQKVEAIKSALPQVDNSPQRVLFSNSGTVAEMAEKRMDLVRNSPTFNSIPSGTTSGSGPAIKYKLVSPGFASGEEIKAENLWVQTFGSNVKQNKVSGLDGYIANSSGIALGVDKKIYKDTIIGAGLSYASSNVKSQSGLQSNRIESYQLSIYSGHDFKQYYINNVIGISFNEYSSHRSILGANENAKANYSGQSYFLRSEIGTRKQLQNELILTPTFMITAAHNSVEDYAENGAGALNLEIKNKGVDFLEGRAGIALSKYYTYKKKKLLPEISASYGYDFIGDEQKSISNFVGQTTSFATQGAKVAQGSLKLGAGLQFFQTNDNNLSLDYGFESRSKYRSHYGSLRFRHSF